MTEELLIKTITTYIAFWGWHILAMIFLLGGFIAAMLHNIVFIFTSGILLGICEYMALKRKGELYANKR